MAFNFKPSVQVKKDEQVREALKKLPVVKTPVIKPVVKVDATNAKETAANVSKTRKTSTPYGTKGYLKTAEGKEIPRVVNPIATGLAKVASFGTAEFLPGFKEAEKQSQEQFPVAYGAGQLLGYIGPTGIATGVTKGLVKGATKKLASATAKRVAEGAIVGTTAEATQIVKPLITGEITPTQASKQLATGAAVGGAIDVGFGVLSKIAKPILSKIKAGQVLSQAEKATAAKQMNVPVEEVDTLIQRELGLPKETTAQDFMRQQEQVAKDIQVDEYYKQFEEPTVKQETSIVKPLVEEPIVRLSEQPTSLVKPLVSAKNRYEIDDTINIMGDNYLYKGEIDNGIRVVDQKTGKETFIPNDFAKDAKLIT